MNSRSSQFELIQPLDGPSVHADWLEERGEGFHHVGYVVRSLEQTTAEMEASGYPVVARIHSFGADRDGAAAYYDDTADALGFLVVAVEPPTRMPAPDFAMELSPGSSSAARRRGSGRARVSLPCRG